MTPICLLQSGKTEGIETLKYNSPSLIIAEWQD